MAIDKIEIDNAGTKAVVNQGVGDLIAGINRGGDLSRVSVYIGPDQGVHTGNQSPTAARGGLPFGVPKGHGGSSPF